MFDRAACPDQARLTAMPSVGLTALSVLAVLLRPASSSAPQSDAPSFSHEQVRGEGHGGDGFSQHGQAAEDMHERPARPHAAGRAVRRRAARHFGDAPAWRNPPAAAQTALTSLMARLILEHAEARRASLVAEAGHDL